MFQKILKWKYRIYLKYLRYRFYYVQKEQDIIKIMKNISLFYPYLTSDQLLNIINDCFSIYPLTDVELQKFSILQQKNDLELGIYNYVTFVIWCCCIYSIENSQNNSYSHLLLK